MSKISFIGYLYLPKILLLPAHKLYNIGNILNNSYNFLQFKQVVNDYISKIYIKIIVIIVICYTQKMKNVILYQKIH